jgi:hypothetical protein
VLVVLVSDSPLQATNTLEAKKPISRKRDIDEDQVCVMHHSVRRSVSERHFHQQRTSAIQRSTEMRQCGCKASHLDQECETLITKEPVTRKRLFRVRARQFRNPTETQIPLPVPAVWCQKA